MIFDSHAHYEDEKFDSDRIELLSGMREKGIGTVVNVGSTIETSKKSIALAEQYEDVYAAIGVHPSEIGCLSEEGMEWLRERSAHPKVVAIGEIGLDYYYDNSPREAQRSWFEKQMQLAKEVGKPVVIHSRDACEDTMQIVRKYAREVPGVFHCFSYSLETAKELVKLGWYLSFTGAITFKNARKALQVVEWAPLSRIFIETDSPYLTPEPHRGARNDSRFVPLVAEKIAQVKGLSVEEVAKATMENGKKFFGIE